MNTQTQTLKLMKTPPNSDPSSAPLQGEKLLKTAVNQILRHPDTWDQATWHSECGTKHCIAGWCQILSGNKVSACDAMRDARAALDISSADACWLFSGARSLGEIYHFAKNFSVAGFDRDGFDRDGFNRDGFNRDGQKLQPFDL